MEEKEEKEEENEGKGWLELALHELKSQVIPTYHQFYLMTLPSIDKTMLIAAQNSICLAADTKYID